MNVFVIIPVYNSESYLAATIDSLLDQTYLHTKLLFVNDGSTDKSLSILRDYEKKHENVYVIDKANGGVSSARNAGLAHLSDVDADYFTFIDSDDIADKGYIKAMVAQAENNSADLVSSLVMEVEAGMPLPPPVTDKAWITLEGEPALKELLYDGIIKNHSCTKLYRYSTYSTLRFDEKISIGEDMEYISRVLDASKIIRASLNQQYFYLQRSESAMNAKFTIKRADSYFAAKAISRRLKGRPYLRSASEAKVFTEALSVLSKVYPQRNQYGDLYRECYNEILRLAPAVAQDHLVRRGQRIYATLSILNPKIAILAVRVKSKLKNIF